MSLKIKLITFSVFVVASASLLANQTGTSLLWEPEDQFHIVVDSLPLWQLKPHKKNMDGNPIGVYKELADVIGQQIEASTVDFLQRKGLKVSSQSAYLGLFLPQDSNILYGKDGKTTDERVVPRLITSSTIPWEADDNQTFLQTAFSREPVEASKIPIKVAGPHKHYIVIVNAQMNTVSMKSILGSAIAQGLGAGIGGAAAQKTFNGATMQTSPHTFYYQVSSSYVEIRIWDIAKREVVWTDIQRGERAKGDFLDMQSMLSVLLSRVPGFIPTPSREDSKKLVENATAAWETVLINNSKLAKGKITSNEYQSLRENYSPEEKRQDICEQKLIAIRNQYKSKKITKDMYQLIYLAQQERCDLRWKQY
ncbi:MAG TPA: hypothetical protein DIW64_02400 [Cellvibrio sp.]|nr:hypothetical protein [Cellvibrio sp.]